MQGLGKFRGGVADVTAVKVYLVNSIFPTLVPGLVELMKALEKNKQVSCRGATARVCHCV